MTAPAQQTVKAEFAGGMTKTDFERLLEGDVKGAQWVQPFGADEDYQVPLSRVLIRKYIAEKAIDKQSQDIVEISDEECDKFIALCKARRLNPYEGDAYAIPYWDGRLRRHRWSLITAHSAFLKRAELHPEYDGMDSGIIVQRGDDKILDLPGDFRLDTDKLLGGWAVVYNRNHSHPTVRRVKLTTYIKEFGVWLKDPEGMICKVAEAQGLRDTFPTVNGGLFLREEMEADDDFQRLVNQEPVKRPDMGRAPELERTTQPVNATAQPEKTDGKKRDRKGRPTLVEEPLDNTPEATQPATQQNNVQTEQKAAVTEQKTPPAEQKQQNVEQPAVPEIPKPTENETEEQTAKRWALTVSVLTVRGKLTVEQVVNYLRAEKWMKDNQKQFTDLSVKRLEALSKAWAANEADFVKRILNKQPEAKTA